MDIRTDGTLLKKLRLGRLEPALQREILEFAGGMGYEATITSSSDLHFLFKLYQAEKAKEKRSEETLKKAEDLILRLVGLQHEMVKPRGNASGARDSGKARLALLEGGIKVSKKTKELLVSIGITDAKDAERVVGILGETKTEERVELVKITALGNELVKGVFGRHIEVLTAARDDDFLARLDAMESKKDMIDSWRATSGKEPPAEADYARTPSVVLEDYRTIAERLELKPPVIEADEPEAEGKKYRNKPMDPSDFMSVMLSMGFERAREARHGTLLKNPSSGAVMCVQSAHRKQMQLNGSTIKIKLVEAGVHLDEFEEARKRLRL